MLGVTKMDIKNFDNLYNKLLSVASWTIVIYTILLEVFNLLNENIYISFVIQFLIPVSIVLILIYQYRKLNVSDTKKLIMLLLILVALIVMFFVRVLPKF